MLSLQYVVALTTTIYSTAVLYNHLFFYSASASG